MKLPLYAAASVAEAWVVDVAAQLVEQHTQPAQDVYTQVRKVLLGTLLAATTIPGLSLSTERIF